MIDSIIEQFRAAVDGLQGVQFKQTIFTEGDVVPRLTKYSIDPAYSIGAASSGTISFPKTQLMPFTNAIANFANVQQMAIRYERIGQDPTEFDVDLYREEFMISGSGVFTPGTIQFFCTKPEIAAFRTRPSLQHLRH